MRGELHALLLLSTRFAVSRKNRVKFSHTHNPPFKTNARKGSGPGTQCSLNSYTDKASMHLGPITTHHAISNTVVSNVLLTAQDKDHYLYTDQQIPAVNYFWQQCVLTMNEVILYMYLYVTYFMTGVKRKLQ